MEERGQRETEREGEEWRERERERVKVFQRIDFKGGAREEDGKKDWFSWCRRRINRVGKIGLFNRLTFIQSNDVKLQNFGSFLL